MITQTQRVESKTATERPTQVYFVLTSRDILTLRRLALRDKKTGGHGVLLVRTQLQPVEYDDSGAAQVTPFYGWKVA